MNPANLLTSARFFLSFMMVYFIFENGGRSAHWALFTFLVASLTDYWDGRLARRRNETTVFGALMDPLADKTLTLCAFLSFWKLDLVPGLWVAVVASRDAIVTGFRLFSLGRGGDQAAGASGKRKTFFQMIYISAVLGYLSARRHSFWDPAWEEPVLTLVRVGMVGVVLLVLWSGLRALRGKGTP